MNLVITGARGFIGACLTRYALALGHSVLALDNESRGQNKLPLRGLGDTRFAYWKHDCQGGFRELASEPVQVGWTPDAVVHLAAGTGSLDRPYAELVQLNVEMTKRVYWDAQALGARAFVFPTTSLALGVPESPYVKSKEDAFDWLKAADREQGPGQNILIPVRFFNVAGAYQGASEFREKEVHLLPTLVAAGLERQPFVINGDDYDTVDGTPGRDFIHVRDVCVYLLKLIHCRLDRKVLPTRGRDGALWLGTGRQLTVRQVLSYVNEFFPHLSIPVTVGPRRAFDVGGLQCDPQQVDIFRTWLGGHLTPQWVSIRDEVMAFLARWVGTPDAR